MFIEGELSWNLREKKKILERCSLYQRKIMCKILKSFCMKEHLVESNKSQIVKAPEGQVYV